jgi:hypothetical protein
MKYSCMRSAAFLALMALAPRAWAQSPHVVTIDPAGEHSRVYLSSLDATARQNFAGVFDTPLKQDYKAFALLLTNASGKAIVALTIRWMATSATETGFYDSFIDCLLLGGPGSGSGSQTRMLLPGQSRPAQTPVSFGQSHASLGGTEVASNGERMLVAPGLFVRESLGRPSAGSSLPDALKRAETVSAILDTVVFQDGEVLGPDVSHTLDSLRSRKATIDALLDAVRTGEKNGLDDVEVLKYMASAPPRPDNNPGSLQLRMLAQSLMAARDWKQRLEKMSAIQLPNFHR